MRCMGARRGLSVGAAFLRHGFLQVCSIVRLFPLRAYLTHASAIDFTFVGHIGENAADTHFKWQRWW